MAEFSKAGQRMQSEKQVRRQSSGELISRLRNDSGLKQHLDHAERIIAARGDKHVDDDSALNDVVKAIQIEVSGITASNAGHKITRKDVEEFIARKLDAEH